MASATAAADEAAIREQAYYLWEQDGRPEGREMEYWQRAAVAVAEKGQLATLTKPPPKRSAASKLKAAASETKAAPSKAAKAAAKVKPKNK